MAKTPIKVWDKAHSSEVMDYVLESLGPMIVQLGDKIAAKPNREEIIDLSRILADHVEKCRQIDLIAVINLMADKIHKQQVALQALAAHLDDQTVTGLDKTHAAIVQTALN